MRSDWDGKRFAYPKPIETPADIPATAKVLGFGSVGDDSWGIWGDDSGLYLARWQDQSLQAEVTLFPGKMDKITEARWLGDNLIQAKEKFAKGTLLLTRRVDDSGAVTLLRDDGKSLAQLNNLSLDSLHVVRNNDSIIRLGYSGGVAQILDARLSPLDQWQLPGGEKLRRIVFPQVSGNGGGNDNGNAVALAADGKHLYTLAPTDSGIPQIIATQQIPAAQSLLWDPLLGVLFGNERTCWRLLPGPGNDLLRSGALEAPAPQDIGEPEAHRLHAVVGDNDAPYFAQ